MGLPVESAAVDDGAADRGAVAADVFRGGVDDHRGAMLERPGEERRGGIVEDERHAEPAPQRRDLGDREDFQLRVRQRLAEPGAGAVVGGPGEVLRVVMADEADLDPELLQRLGQEGHRAAIEIGRGDDVVAGPGDVGERDEGRRLPRGERQRRGAAFERGEPFLEDVLGRVLDAGIDLSDLLQGEEAGSVGGVLELERGVLVDRHRHRAGGRVRPPAAAVEREGFGVKAGRGHVPGSLSCGCLRMAGKSRPYPSSFSGASWKDTPRNGPRGVRPFPPRDRRTRGRHRAGPLANRRGRPPGTASPRSATPSPPRAGPAASQKPSSAGRDGLGQVPSVVANARYYR